MIKARRQADLLWNLPLGWRGALKSSLPQSCDGHIEQKKAVRQLAPPPKDQRSGGLTQSGWCEEAGENKQACGPHGLLF